MSDIFVGLKAAAVITIFAIVLSLIGICAKRHGPGFLSFLGLYSTNPNDPLQRQPIGERPKMWDVSIPSWYPLRPRHGSRSESLWRSRFDEENRGTGRHGAAADEIDDENGSRYGEFFVSNFRVQSLVDQCGVPLTFDSCPHKPLSADKVSGAGSSQIRISTIILMPVPPPRSVPLVPSTSSRSPFPNSPGGNGGRFVGFPREYVLGTSHAPYTPDD